MRLCLKDRYLILAPVLWGLAIWAVSSLPSDNLKPPQVLGFDKLAHSSVYFVLALLTNRAIKGKKLSLAWLLFIYALLILNAAIDEYHQRFIPGRSVSVWDLAANATGLIAGFAVGWIRRDLRA